jgi:enoyl-CoA hydratase/carnithine racemase
MQQAYRILRIVAEAETIRIVLNPDPDSLMLSELRIACAGLIAAGHDKSDPYSSSGIKAVVLDFSDTVNRASDGEATHQASPISGIEEAVAAVRAVVQPVVAVVRATPSATAGTLIEATDLTLIADDATLLLPGTDASENTLPGVQAARLGYVTWSAPANNINKELERILDLLREKSAIALRLTKASVRLGQTNHLTRLEALKQVNNFYLTAVMKTADASEGLQAFLGKRKPNWKNM